MSTLAQDTNSAAWDRVEFEARLRGKGAGYHIHHPFNVKMNSGQLTPAQIRGWVANRFYYQVNIPQKRRRDHRQLSGPRDPPQMGTAYSRPRRMGRQCGRDRGVVGTGRIGRLDARGTMVAAARPTGRTLCG